MMSSDKGKEKSNEVFRRMWEDSPTPPPLLKKEMEGAFESAAPPRKAKQEERKEESGSAPSASTILTEQAGSAWMKIATKEIVSIVFVIIVTAFFFSLLSFNRWYQDARKRVIKEKKVEVEYVPSKPKPADYKAF